MVDRRLKLTLWGVVVRGVLRRGLAGREYEEGGDRVELALLVVDDNEAAMSRVVNAAIFPRYTAEVTSLFIS